MKLLTIVSDSICTGAAISLLNLILGLKQKGIEIEVITPRDGFLCSELKKNGIKYHIIPYVFSVYPPTKDFKDLVKFLPRLFKTLVINIFAIFKINNIYLQFKPDIIHTNVSVINIGYIIAQMHKIPHIWHVREYGDIDFGFYPFPSKRKKKQSLQNSYTISITHDLATYFELGNRNKVIYNGIANEDEIIYEPQKDDSFIYVGWITENKGAFLLVDSFAIFSKHNPSYQLKLIGEGDEKYIEILKGRIKKLGIENKVKFIGYTNNVQDFMKKAKAIIVPSKKEAFGRITAEAMFNGCLVIGRNTGGTKEQFDNGLGMIGEEIGLRFDNQESLISCMERVTSMEDSIYQRIVLNAQSVVKNLYSNENNIELTSGFLEEILNQK